MAGDNVQTSAAHPFDRRIASGWEQASRENPDPTVRYFKTLLREDHLDARLLFEYASALDFAGREAEALPVYEQAFQAGLPAALEPRASIQYGSTLKNVGRLAESDAALRRARDAFPEDPAVLVYLALTLVEMDGRQREACGILLDVLADNAKAVGVERYRWALKQYASFLLDADETGAETGTGTDGAR